MSHSTATERDRESENQNAIPTFTINQFTKDQNTALGAGRFGRVDLYTCNENGQKRAIKTFIRIDPEMFKREIAPLLEFNHDHIVTIFGILVNYQFDAIVMEFMEGGSLEQVIHEETPRFNYTLKDVLRWSIQSASALEYMHTFKNLRVYNEAEEKEKKKNNLCIHRDVKPGNMVLDSTGKILKLCDFGLSKEVDSSKSNTKNIGTWRYIAPEVLTGTHYNEKCDVYAWGLTLRECLSREKPFHDCTEVTRHCAEYLKSYTFRPITNVSSKFNQILHSLTNFEPKNRLSMSAAKVLLENLIENLESYKAVEKDSEQNNTLRNEKISIWNEKSDELFYCERLDLNSIPDKEKPEKFERELKKSQDTSKISEVFVWSITKDFDINFCQNLEEEWENSYTSFFQLSLFQNQFVFKACAAVDKKLFYFITNKSLHFEEFFSFNTLTKEVKKESSLPEPQKSLTCAVFKNGGKNFMLVHSELKDPQTPSKCLVYDFENKEFRLLKMFPESNLKYARLVSFRKSVVAFFMNDDSTANEAHFYDRNTKKWSSLTSPNKQYRYSTTALAYHEGAIFVKDGDKFQRFDPETDEWVDFLSVGCPTSATRLFSFSRRLYALADNGDQRDVWVLEKNTWKQLKSIPLSSSGVDFFAV